MPLKITTIPSETLAGDLRYKVGFYVRPALPASSPPIDYGNVEDSFPDTPSFIVSANITPKLGGEDVLAARLTGRAFVNITVRQSANTATITSDWMAKNERTGETYNVRSIIDPQGGTPKHGFYFEMLCERGVAV